MRVAYIGNFRHPWCTEVHIARDIEGLGHEVLRLQEPHAGEGARQFLRLAERKASECQLLLYTRTWGLPPQATQLWRRLERRGVITASYHLDLYVGLRRQASLRGDPFWSTGHVFTPDGDPGSAEVFAQLGINHHWSPPAVVSDECTPGSWQDRYDFDVVFVGSRGYHAEWPWRIELLDWLEHTYGDRYRRFGGDMPGGPTRGQDLNDLYATARVVVGDSLCLPGHTRYWSDRYYETVGRGGFLIGPFVPGLEEHFTGGKDLCFYEYGDLAGLRAHVDEHLDHPEVGRAIAAVGQAHVAANHTYRHRLAGAFAELGLA